MRTFAITYKWTDTGKGHVAIHVADNKQKAFQIFCGSFDAKYRGSLDVKHIEQIEML